MKKVNKFDGKPFTESDESSIVENTICSGYPSVGKKAIEEALEVLLDVLFAVAWGNDTEVEI